MIDCAQYRRILLAEPRSVAPELSAHLQSCSACREFTERLNGFEARLERAMRLAVPPAGSKVVPLRGAGPRAGGAGGGSAERRRFVPQAPLAMAASLLLGIGLVFTLWLALPRTSLASDVVAHMAGEPDAWRRTDTAVPAERFDQVLQNAHMRLAAGAGTVSYAMSCEFRGHHVPHFVVQTAMGPVTVMVLVHEHVSSEVRFDEQGYRGVIVPVPGHGALAILSRGDNADSAAVEGIAAQLLRAIEWT